MFECIIKVSNSEKTNTTKSLQYEEDVIISENSPILHELIKKAVEEFKGEVEDVRVTLKFQV
jgi:bifunctional DNase/RNase